MFRCVYYGLVKDLDPGKYVYSFRRYEIEWKRIKCDTINDYKYFHLNDLESDKIIIWSLARISFQFHEMLEILFAFATWSIC